MNYLKILEKLLQKGWQLQIEKDEHITLCKPKKRTTCYQTEEYDAKIECSGKAEEISQLFSMVLKILKIEEILESFDNITISYDKDLGFQIFDTETNGTWEETAGEGVTIGDAVSNMLIDAKINEK